MVGGKDPDEIIKKYGRDKFKGMLDGASNDTEFALLEIRKKYNVSTSQGKIDFLNEALKVLAGVSPIEQDIYISRLSDELSVDKSSIKIQLDSYLKKRNYRQRRNEYKAIVDNSVRDNQRKSYDENISIRQIKAEERIVGLLLRYPDCFNLAQSFDSQILSSAFIKKVFAEIMKRLDAKLDIDLINFSSSLTTDELGRLSGIIARTRESKDSKKEFKDCIAIIQSEYEKNIN